MRMEDHRDVVVKEEVNHKSLCMHQRLEIWA